MIFIQEVFIKDKKHLASPRLLETGSYDANTFKNSQNPVGIKFFNND
jgi:hypothetical protein